MRTMKNKGLKLVKIGLLVVCLAFTPALMAQRVAVKTNLLLDGLAMPNLGFEMVTGKCTTLSVSMLSFEKCLKADLKAMALQPEFRYWYSQQPMNRGYVGLIGLTGFYKGLIGKDTYDGYGGGAGLSFGYVMNLTKRLNLELSTGFGAFYYHQKRYAGAEEPEGVVPEKGYMLMPMQVGVSLSYVIK